VRYALHLIHLYMIIHYLQVCDDVPSQFSTLEENFSPASVIKILACKPVPGRAQGLMRYCIILSTSPLAAAALSGIYNNRRMVQDSSSLMANISLNDTVQITSTSREWVLAPVLECVLPEMVDRFLKPSIKASPRCKGNL
jgi:hypothetical protein